MGAVVFEAGSSFLRPPTRNGLLKASTSEVTFAAPKPLTLDKTLLGCLTILAKDWHQY